MKITAAMKMVSAAKLKKAQDAITHLRPYEQRLNGMMQKVNATIDLENNPFAKQGEAKRVLLVVITSNRGLCGAFNSSVTKLAGVRLKQFKNAEVEIIAVGKKGNDTLKKTGKVSRIETDIWNGLSYGNSMVLSNELIEGFTSGKWDHIELVYNQFKNAAMQITTAEQFLPMALDESTENENTDYIFEPTQENILDVMIPLSLHIKLFKALIDSNASEHGARMTAMHKATDNAKDLQGRLKLEYNKARQAAITNEILEIVSGADALVG
jgi:F-type H+-transporting ATPase subunit gamma